MAGFFFFQAEDGIRYSSVTGVQTCALPIYRLVPVLFAVDDEHRNKPVGTDLLAQAQRRAEALGCKRMELYLPAVREYRHDFFEQQGFSQGSGGLFVRATRVLR